MERTVVTQFLYPAFLEPSIFSDLSDQFAFRPTGSTTRAIVSILHSVTHHLLSNSYVIVMSLDFSKAFDTVRHSTLLQKLARLDMPDQVYNWLVDFFSGHSHCTEYCCELSPQQEISASIVQGSSIGPASYVLNASDLKAITQGNETFKYADDIYIIIPSRNADSRTMELDNIMIAVWSKANNLKLKC